MTEMRFTGGADSATPIIDWVLACGGTARWSEAHDGAPERIAVAGAGDALVGDWVILGVTGRFFVRTTEAVTADYRRVAEHPAPHVGAAVHYVSFGTPGGEYTSQCRAAIVAAVPDRTGYADHADEVLDLCVLNPSGIFFNRCPHVEYGGAPAAEESGMDLKGGTWHWRIEACR